MPHATTLAVFDVPQGVTVGSVGPADGVTSDLKREVALKARVKDQDVDTGGLETLVFLKSDGRWRIRPSHTSARRRPEG